MVEAKIGEIIKGLTSIFGVFGLFLMVSGSTSLKELRHALKSVISLGDNALKSVISLGDNSTKKSELNQNTKSTEKIPLEVEDLISCNLCEYDTFDQNELNKHEKVIHGKDLLEITQDQLFRKLQIREPENGTHNTKNDESDMIDTPSPGINGRPYSDNPAYVVFKIP